MDYEKFFQLLSNFMDDDKEFDFIDDFERTLEDEFCEHFFNTFRRTVELCHQIQMCEVPRRLHYQIIRTIESSARPAYQTDRQALPYKKIRKPSRKKKISRKKHIK